VQAIEANVGHPPIFLMPNLIKPLSTAHLLRKSGHLHALLLSNRATTLVKLALPLDTCLIVHGSTILTATANHLLFVASDRISAYDVILKNVCGFFLARSCFEFLLDQLLASLIGKGIPDRGRVLTELSLFWFDKLKHIISNHVITSRIEEMPEELQQHKEQLEGRSILVRKAEVVPLEAIVRGYITGEYSTLLYGE
jgi:SAICAR synthetase